MPNGAWHKVASGQTGEPLSKDLDVVTHTTTLRKPKNQSNVYAVNVVESLSYLD
jgi:hypothetical protein